jgi:hypothetical protein
MQNVRQRRSVAFTLGASLCLFLASGAIYSPPDIVAQTPGAPTSGNIVVAAMNAPVVPEGDVAGRPTEFIVVLDRALDPQVEGRSLVRGKRIKVILPDAFKRTNAAIRTPDSAILTKGWPQGGITTFALTLEGTQTVVFTATDDIVPRGPNNPGIKMIHVRGALFTNPAAGRYPIGVEAETGPGGTTERGTGMLTVRPAIVPSISVSNALFPQPSNNNWQRVPVNTLAPIPLDFLLFAADGTAMDGVLIAPADRTRFPRYTGGLLVKGGTVVGGIIGSAPPGARGQNALSPIDIEGRPIPSGQLTLPNGRPASGIMRVLFITGNRPGFYRPTFELMGGTSVQMTMVAPP